MSAITDVTNFLSKAFKGVLNWIKAEEVKLKPVLSIAENLLNGLKKFEGSAVGQTIEAIIEAEIPASTGLINAFKLQLPVWLVELKWIENESNKNLDQQWADALAYLETIKGLDTYAAQYNTLKALFTKFFGSNAGYVVNIQQALTLAQPSHNPELITG